MDAAWKALGDEIARWRDAGRSVDFWWRDDDAAQSTPALQQLLALAAEHDVPLALAVVPEAADPACFASLAGNAAGIAVLQHGCDHRNRAEAGGKKTEFPGSEPVDETIARLLAARVRLTALAAKVKVRALPVLVPPWNRFPSARALQLAAAGYSGLSTFGPRPSAQPAPGLTQINTHIDIIDWRGGRGFIGEARALEQATRHLAARRAAAADPAADPSLEPTGWLTHHAVHDAACWDFLARLFDATRGAAGVKWRDAAGIFEGENSP